MGGVFDKSTTKHYGISVMPDETRVARSTIFGTRFALYGFVGSWREGNLAASILCCRQPLIHVVGDALHHHAWGKDMLELTAFALWPEEMFPLPQDAHHYRLSAPTLFNMLKCKWTNISPVSPKPKCRDVNSLCHNFLATLEKYVRRGLKQLIWFVASETDTYIHPLRSTCGVRPRACC